MKFLRIALFVVVVSTLVLWAIEAHNSATTRTDSKNVEGLAQYPRIAIVIDKTGSTERFGVPDIKISDLEPLFDLFLNCGGDLAIGQIRNLSNQPFVRLHIQAPPVPPQDESSSENNIIRIGQAQAAYRRALEVYEKALSDWQDMAGEEIEKVKLPIDSVLSLPPDARLTDVVSAFDRVYVFLSELPEDLKSKQSLFVLFCSDGYHSSSRHPIIKPMNHVTALVVPGSNLGILEQLNPLQFESPDAAIRHIVSTVRQSNRSGNLAAQERRALP